MLRQGLLFLSESGVARMLVTHAPFARWAARRFVVGETMDEAVDAARTLNAKGVTVSLDYLGESVTNRDEAIGAADTYLRIIDRMAAEGLDGNVSLKLTQMGQDIDEAFLHTNVTRVLGRARERGLFVRFDMESSEYVQPTLDFFGRLRGEGYDNCGVVLQSYLYRTVEDVKWANELGARVRLCKGAYAEPPEVAYPEKSDVDASFVRSMKLLLEHGAYPGIATHDEAMIDATTSFARERGIDPSRFEFQMLYGIRRDLQDQLVADGWRLRVYMGFGAAWYPYFMRRLAERPANVLFVASNVFRELFR
ncbi:MAG TPA: proline dehydrogenase family protein [Longimicrobiales bacterium]|nr:proline dehydrogenase family protein [Longimicrobiales bacterium]